MEHNLFTVHDTGQGILKIIDATRGIQAGVISPRGKLVTPPVVSGNTVSFVVQSQDNTRLGQVHKLPSGSLINQYRA
tara:strand:- start:2406 stop:2636 length:231 start_codon:yes stop_codon:yes gene_type:complete